MLLISYQDWHNYLYINTPSVIELTQLTLSYSEFLLYMKSIFIMVTEFKTSISELYCWYNLFLKSMGKTVMLLFWFTLLNSLLVLFCYFKILEKLMYYLLVCIVITFIFIKHNFGRFWCVFSTILLLLFKFSYISVTYCELYDLGSGIQKETVLVTSSLKHFFQPPLPTPTPTQKNNCFTVMLFWNIILQLFMFSYSSCLEKELKKLDLKKKVKNNATG